MMKRRDLSRLFWKSAR